MELLVFNKNLEDPIIFDAAESNIWTERYCGYGDFEIYTKASAELLNTLKNDYYIFKRGSDTPMVIEDRQVKTDIEDGNYIIIKGRSIESLLDRRIIWKQTVLSGNLQNGIKKLLDENVISPEIPERAIPNFVFELSDDPAIISLTVEAQFTRGSNLYEAIKNLCLANNIGFKITLSHITKIFTFSLYSGVDRSYSQFERPYIVFSKKMGNIISTDYNSSMKPLKNIVVVDGEGEEPDRKSTVVGNAEGLDRREMYTDARDLSQIVDGVEIPENDYIAQLAQRGMEKLKENSFEESFEGQVDTFQIFKYGEDFFMGDIVQLVSEYGVEGRARVTEIIYSESTSGVDLIPTFTMIDD